MRLGLSNLLGEFLEARHLSYEDCRAFQVVCPACREPVFKVARAASPRPVDYLSHYGVDSAYEKDCELRVANIGSSEVERANAEARGQTLRLFLSVLREAILSSEYPSDGRAAAERLARGFRESKGFRRLRESMFEHAHDTFRRMTFDEADEFLEDYVQDVTSVGGSFPRTAFALTKQKRIAWDVWKHVLSPAARGNYYFLHSHAVVLLISRIESAGRERAAFEYERIMVYSLRKFLDAPTAVGDIVMRQLATTPIGAPHALDDSDLLSKLAAEITHEGFGILLRLPYFELLKDARATESEGDARRRASKG